jgi:hypothetical protein
VGQEKVRDDDDRWKSNDNQKSFLSTVQIRRNIPMRRFALIGRTIGAASECPIHGTKQPLLDKINTELEQSFSLCVTMCFEMGCEEESLACCETCVLI